MESCGGNSWLRLGSERGRSDGVEGSVHFAFKDVEEQRSRHCEQESRNGAECTVIRWDFGDLDGFSTDTRIPTGISAEILDPMVKMQDVYKIIYDTHGQYWPYIHHYIIITIVLMQLTMIGLFGLKSKPGASVSTVALVLLTVLFNEYCKIRFLPSFQHRPIQIAKEMDDQELEGQIEGNQAASVINAYRAPWMRPVAFQASSSIEPLVSA